MSTDRKINLKVCGMRDAENIMQVAALQPDLMGFIFYAKSPRYVGTQFRIPVELPRSIKRVGVFVNESTEVMLEKAKTFNLDYLQLHGQESVEQCAELKKHNIKIIKVFSVDDQFDFEVTSPYAEVTDFFLFDTKGKYYGGNAVTFDWSILDRYDQQVPFFLSGGINPDNASGIKAFKEINLYAIDINSGVEVSPAVKDPVKVKAIKHMLNSPKISSD